MAKLNFRSKSFWRSTIDRCQRSGLNVKQFCQRENLAISTYYDWQRRIKYSHEKTSNQPFKKSQRTNQPAKQHTTNLSCNQPAEFLPISVASELTSTIEIDFANNIVVRITNHCDEKMLTTVLRALKNISC